MYNNYNYKSNFSSNISTLTLQTIQLRFLMSFGFGVLTRRYLLVYSMAVNLPHIILFILCQCACVFFLFILDIKFVGRTSRGHTEGRSHRNSHPPSFCGACLNFSREKDSATPFPRRPSSRILCTNDLIVLHPLGIFYFSF